MKSRSAINLGIASVASLAAFTGCSSEKDKYAKWMETPGTANRINLDAVQKALEESKSVDEFEVQVNKIYEGPHRVLIEIVDAGNGKKRVSGYEDVNNNKVLDTGSDFLLFKTTVGDGSYEMRGGGAHNYYHHTGYYHTGGTGTFFMGYIMGSMMSGPYRTPYNRVNDIDIERTRYRSTPAYRQQQKQNMAFRKAQLAKNPGAAKGFRSRTPSVKRGGFRSGS